LHGEEFCVWGRRASSANLCLRCSRLDGGRKEGRIFPKRKRLRPRPPLRRKGKKVRRGDELSFVRATLSFLWHPTGKKKGRNTSSPPREEESPPFCLQGENNNTYYLKEDLTPEKTVFCYSAKGGSCTPWSGATFKIYRKARGKGKRHLRQSPF